MIFEVEEELKKVCTGCKISKNLEEYCINISGKLGRNARCRACMKIKAKIGNTKTAERLKKEGYKIFPEDTKKVCTLCNIEKYIADFTRKLGGVFGVESRCRVCKNSQQAEKIKNSPELREQNKIYAKEYRKRIPEYSQNRNKKRVKNTRLLADYNIDLEGYKEMQIAQNNCCAICKKSRNEVKKELCVDHNHDNGKVRGLLCTNCNMALGLFKDNSEFLFKAAEYINFYKEIHSKQ